MTGLILKDFINLKKYLRILLLIVIFYAVIYIPKGNADFIASFLIFLGAMPVMSTISIDDNSKWNSYASTMPIKRTDIVLSKYILMMIFILCSGLFCFTLLTVADKFNNSFNLERILLITLASTCLGLIYDSINIPIVFKLGSEKARLIMMLVLFIPFGITLFLSKTLEKSTITSLINIINSYQSVLPIIVIGATILIVVSSYFISANIFAKKEF